ncbi:MAG TPA: hypothetical protein VK850_13540, partial [Candidatus Binatia bacterium]|nr:hypothetical protein [Candidatus Binatia bacterium]
MLAAHSLFFFGIWNARENYGEETNNVWNAFQVLRTHKPSASIYVDAMALVLRFVTPDPLAAATFMRYFSSVLATIALWFALRPFSGVIRQSALLSACLAFTASAFNAPFVHSTSISLFTFAIMLLGVHCLLVRVSPWLIVGFGVLGLLASAMRPEFCLPLCLGLALMAAQAWRRLQPPVRKWCAFSAVAVVLMMAIVVLIKPPAPLKKAAAYLDQYALLGLGQCYAGFYLQEHPTESFDPATEYHIVLKRVFGDPTGFSGAAKNNPGEVARYLVLNTARNLFS